MATGYLLLENLALDGTLEGGAWEESLPLANVLDPQITSLPARCSDASDLEASQIGVNWESVQFITDVMICGHTGGLDTRWKLTAWEGEEELLAIDWTDVYGRLYPTDSIPFEQGNWFTGQPREKDIRGYARHLLIRLPQVVAADSLLIELDATGNQVDFDIGYLFVGARLAPGWTFTWGRQAGLRRRTLREATAGGRRIVTRRTNARTQTVTWPHLTKAEAYRIYDHAMAEDIHPAILVPDPDDVDNAFREVFPAWLEATGEPRQANEFGEWSVTVTMEEMQG